MSEESAANQILPPGIAAPEGAILATPAKRGRPKKSPGAAPKSKTALAIPEEQISELENKRAEYAADLKTVQTFPLDTQEQADTLTAVCQSAKAQQEELEGRMKKITDPLNAAVKEVKSLFGPPIEFLKSIRTAGKVRLEQRFAQQRAAQAQALAAVAESAGRVDGVTMSLATGAAHVKPSEGTYEVEEWSYEITDHSQLPFEFWIPNADLLAKTAKANKAAAVVPGVRFFSQRRLVVRGV